MHVCSNTSMYNGDQQNYINEAPQGNGASGASPYTDHTKIHEELDKREAAQRSAQDELSHALQEERTQAHRAGTIPRIEHTARIAVTPVPEHTSTHPAANTPSSDGATLHNKTEGMNLTEKETVNGATHSMNTRASSPSNPLHDKNLPVTPGPQADSAEVEKYVPNPALRTLRTMQSDMAQATGKGQESVASIALAAHKKREEEKAPPVAPTQPAAPAQKEYRLPEISLTKTPPTIRSYRPTQQAAPAPQPSYTPPQPKAQPSTPTPVYRPAPAPQPAPPSTGSMKSSYVSSTEPVPVRAAASVPIIRNIALVFISVLLLGLGGFGLYSVFMVKEVQDTGVPITQPNTAVRYDTFSRVSFTARDTLISVVKGGIQSLPATPGSVWYAHTEDVSAESLLTTLFPTIPDVLARTTQNPVALGYYRHDQGPRFYITFTVSTFGQAFSGALRWEESMYEDVRSLLAKSPSGTTYGFLDGIIGNKDVRKLVNTNGEPFIVYGFIDQNTFVLTEDDATFAAIANNIFADRSVR